MTKSNVIYLLSLIILTLQVILLLWILLNSYYPTTCGVIIVEAEPLLIML